MIKKIQQFINLFLQSCYWLYAYFIQKDEKIWVFGAIRGEKYMDNAKYLFEYVDKNTDIQAVWISKNLELVNELNSRGIFALYEYSNQARYYAKRASIAIVTHRGNQKKADLPMYCFSKQTKVIQLWHGIPLKKIAYDDKVFSFKHDEESVKWKIKVLLKDTLIPFLNYIKKPSLTLSLSEETQNIFSKAFRVEKNKVLITGYPRNDILLNSVISNNEMRKKKIIYMPTFRGSVNSDFDLFLQYGFDVDVLDVLLDKLNMQLDIKLHPFNKPSFKLLDKLNNASNISFLENDAIYEVLGEYAMLITDYSSIYFDYLLLDRPIIFAPFDKDTYMKEDREFYFDYDAVTPGPKAMNWNEVINCIEKYSADETMYAQERKEITDKFHTFQDNKSTQRVYESILALV